MKEYLLEHYGTDEFEVVQEEWSDDEDFDDDEGSEEGSEQVREQPRWGGGGGGGFGCPKLSAAVVATLRTYACTPSLCPTSTPPLSVRLVYLLLPQTLATGGHRDGQVAPLAAGEGRGHGQVVRAGQGWLGGSCVLTNLLRICVVVLAFLSYMPCCLPTGTDGQRAQDDCMCWCVCCACLHRVCIINLGEDLDEEEDEGEDEDGGREFVGACVFSCGSPVVGKRVAG